MAVLTSAMMKFHQRTKVTIAFAAVRTSSSLADHPASRRLDKMEATNSVSMRKRISVGRSVMYMGFSLGRAPDATTAGFQFFGGGITAVAQYVHTHMAVYHADL